MDQLRQVLLFAHPTKAPGRHRLLRQRLLAAMVMVAIVDAFGTFVIWRLEEDVSGSGIDSLWDAFFFTTLQLLTVSSQLPNPVTTGGQALDIFLALTAICLVTGIAGVFASFFLSDEDEDEDEDAVR